MNTVIFFLTIALAVLLRPIDADLFAKNSTESEKAAAFLQHLFDIYAKGKVDGNDFRAAAVLSEMKVKPVKNLYDLFLRLATDGKMSQAASVDFLNEVIQDQTTGHSFFSFFMGRFGKNGEITETEFIAEGLNTWCTFAILSNETNCITLDTINAAFKKYGGWDLFINQVFK